MPADLLVLFAHPDRRRSRVGAQLAHRLTQAGLPLALRDLYALYPDYDIDVAAEQQALREARLLLWLHPIHWYGMPPLMKLWLDEVLAHGWAYGPGGQALAGKDLLLVASTGGSAARYQHHHPEGFAIHLPPYEATARQCQMRWLAPMLLHDAHGSDAAALDAFAERLLARLQAYPGGEDGLWPLREDVPRTERPQER